jgi:hypothetical protein
MITMAVAALAFALLFAGAALFATIREGRPTVPAPLWFLYWPSIMAAKQFLVWTTLDRLDGRAEGMAVVAANQLFLLPVLLTGIRFRASPLEVLASLRRSTVLRRVLPVIAGTKPQEVYVAQIGNACVLLSLVGIGVSGAVLWSWARR